MLNVFSSYFAASNMIIQTAAKSRFKFWGMQALLGMENIRISLLEISHSLFSWQNFLLYLAERGQGEG